MFREYNRTHYSPRDDYAGLECSCECDRKKDRIIREQSIRERNEKMEKVIKSYPKSKTDIDDLMIFIMKKNYIQFSRTDIDYVLKCILEADTFPHEILKLMFYQKYDKPIYNSNYKLFDAELNPNNFPFFWIACARGDIDTVLIFLEDKRMDYKNGGSYQGYNHPLIISYSNRHLHLFELFVKTENVMKDTNINDTLFKRAFYDGELEYIKLLAPFCDANICDRYDLSDYGKYAVRTQSEKTLIELIDILYSNGCV
jgi:hypothetical protein